MISNIFGLHLGCKCKSDTDEFTLFGMRPSPFECEDTVYLQGEYNDLYDIKDCKLLLKHLSAMSDEDKKDFLDKFYPEKDIFWRYMRVTGFNKEGIEVYSTRQGDSPYGHTRKYSIQEGIWLCSKGYDVGIVPDEYKEVSE